MVEAGGASAPLCDFAAPPPNARTLPMSWNTLERKSPVFPCVVAFTPNRKPSGEIGTVKFESRRSPDGRSRSGYVHRARSPPSSSSGFPLMACPRVCCRLRRHCVHIWSGWLRPRATSWASRNNKSRCRSLPHHLTAGCCVFRTPRARVLPERG